MGKYLFWKPKIDFIFAVILLVLLFPVLLFFFITSSMDVHSNGIFKQERVGQFGKTFIIYKFQTINPRENSASGFGRFLRKYKIDELPQLFNIIKGEMSFVGPRPDIPGYYDTLQGEDRKILNLKPGLTSEASIKYRNEEESLQQQEDSEYFNDFVLFPDKVKMNLEYLEKMSLKTDIKIIIKTIITIFEK